MSTADIQNTAYNLAQTAFNNAVTSTNNMVAALNSTSWQTDLGVQPPTTVYSHIGFVPPPGTPSVPSFDGVSAPASPIIGAFTVPNIGNIPELTVAEPLINMPVAPSMDLPAAPGAAPEFNVPNIPDKPVFSLPSAPTFQPVALPETPLIELPLFDMQADFGDVIAPTERFVWSEQEYTSALLDETKAKLLHDIINGGYGIDEEDERRLWDRAREREAAASAERVAEFARATAARGFTLPPGSLYAMEEAAAQDMLDKVASLSREIAIKRADMYVENRRFTITTSLQLEDMMIRYWGSMAERALNAARTQVELGVAIFNAQVSKFAAKVQAYQGYAAAFEARVRAALAGVEIYKAQIEGAKLTVDVQKLYADVYQTQVNGVNSLVNLYKTEMDAAQVAAQIEQLKLAAFRSQVEAYAEQVRAQAAKFDMFEAQVKGEVAKVQVYDSSVRAYAARLQGVESKARVAETVSRTEIAQASAKLDIYKTDMERYRAEIGVITERINAALRQYDGQLKQYSVATDALKAYGDNDIRAQEANSRNYVAYSQIVAERLRVMVEQVIKDMEVRAASNNAAAQSAASLGSAWASAVTGLSADITSA